jgi:hypothetical protein
MNLIESAKEAYPKNIIHVGKLSEKEIDKLEKHASVWKYLYMNGSVKYIIRYNPRTND